MSKTTKTINKNYIDYALRKGLRETCPVCHGKGTVKCNERHFQFKKCLDDIQPAIDVLKTRKEVLVASIQTNLCKYHCERDTNGESLCEVLNKIRDDAVIGCITYYARTGKKFCRKCDGIGEVKVNVFNAVIK